RPARSPGDASPGRSFGHGPTVLGCGMPQRSAGILLFRICPDGPQVLLGHPGGPFWARRDAGAWTIPKGEIDPDEAPSAAARREFAEETGHDLATVATGELIPLGEAVQASRKVVIGFAA